jgi:predicted nucleotide-binding protein with TIR-like domain
MNKERAIFVGGSEEAAELAAKVASAVAVVGMSPVVWNLGAFPAGQTLLERIENLPYEFDGAVLLATPDIRCIRRGKSFLAPASNVIFEYGYLSSQLTRRRVAICRFGEADMPSDLEGLKVIEGNDADYGARELPQHMKRELTSWLDGLPRLAAGVSPITQSHGYSGRWGIENRFDLWRGFRIEHPDSIYFHGIAILSIPSNGRGGTGVMYGATYISVQDYSSRLDVVNEIRDATVDDNGGLRLRIEVVRRHLGHEEGDPPDRRFRESMQSRDFEVRLHPVAGVPNALHGEHLYTRANEIFSSGTERYIHHDGTLPR